MTHVYEENGEDTFVVENDEQDSVSNESESSEIERLGTATPVENGIPLETPTERGVAKTKKLEDIIFRIIAQAKALGSNTVDLCGKGVRQIPEELLELSHLEYLYLEGNELCSLPDDFFDKLPNLVWLDLRKNGLLRLPSVYTGRHQHLRNLLLEGNNLRSLPLELGLIKSLNGLNISNNPLEFPPGDVIEKGTNEILKFLREMLLAKSQGRLTTTLNGGGENGEDSSSSSEDWQDERDLRDWAKIQHRSLSMEDNKSTTTKSSEFGLIPHPAELHRPVSYTEMKQEKTDKIKKAGAMGTVDRNRPKSGTTRRPKSGTTVRPKSSTLGTRLASSSMTQSVDRALTSKRRNDPSRFSFTWQNTLYPSRLDTSSHQHCIAVYKKIKRESESMLHIKESNFPHFLEKVEQSRSMGFHGSFKLVTMKREHQQKNEIPSIQVKVAKRKPGAPVERRRSASNSVLSWKVNPYPEPPPAEYIHFKMNEERQLAKVKDFKEKTDAILQRRKDENVLKEWRQETKKIQQKRQIDMMRSGKKDYVDPVEKAPFDIDQDHVKIMSNEERIKQDVKNAHEKLRRQLSPTSRQRIEEEKAARIKELEKKIKLHTAQMHARRKHQKGSPQEEMEAARRDLEIAEDLHKELMNTRKTLEYRFRAFTAEVSSHPRPRKTQT